MDYVSSRLYSFLFDIDDGVITPTEPQKPDLKVVPASLGSPPSSSTTLGKSSYQTEDILSPMDGSYFLPASVRRLHRPSRPPPLTRLPSSILPASSWFDDTPTGSVFSITNEGDSIAGWDVHSEWLDEDSDTQSTKSSQNSEIDKMSTFTFGRCASPYQSSDSHESSTIVPTDVDSESIQLSKSRTFDSWDKQLLTSPIDSFAAVCWSSAVTEQKNSNTTVPEIRLSKLFDDTARGYEEQHRNEYLQHAEKVPCMQFSGEFVSCNPSEEVAPWMHLPKKAISVLDLPNDTCTRVMKYSSVSQILRHENYRGRNSPGSIAGKRKRVGFNDWS